MDEAICDTQRTLLRLIEDDLDAEARGADAEHRFIMCESASTDLEDIAARAGTWGHVDVTRGTQILLRWLVEDVARLKDVDASEVLQDLRYGLLLE